MINKIWASFIFLGIIYSFFTGNIELLNKEIFKSCEQAFNMCVKMLPILALWLGIVNIAKVSGFLQKATNLLTFFLKKLFPEIPKNHESLSYIAGNIIVNMFGLGNVATPLGLKAMKSLQQINEKKDTASRSMITFLVLNTSGVTIIPTTVIAMRMTHGSKHPTEIILACIITTIVSLIFALTLDRIFARKNKT